MIGIAFEKLFLLPQKIHPLQLAKCLKEWIANRKGHMTLLFLGSKWFEGSRWSYAKNKPFGDHFLFENLVPFTQMVFV